MEWSVCHRPISLILQYFWKKILTIYMVHRQCCRLCQKIQVSRDVNFILLLFVNRSQEFISSHIFKNNSIHFVSIPVVEQEIFVNLTKAAEQNGHFKVYNEHNLPDRWHAHNRRRMGPILALADIGYGFQDLFAAAKKYEEEFNVPCK